MLEFENLVKDKFFELIDYTPHSDGQWQFHNCNAKHRIACCGRRWGKSLAAANELSFAALKPDSVYWIVGPTYKLAEKEFRIVHQNFTRKIDLRKYLRVSYNTEQGHMRIQFPWRTIVQCASATNADSL